MGTDLYLTAEGSGQQFFSPKPFVFFVTSGRGDKGGSANERRNAMNDESSEAEKHKNTKPKTELPTKWFFFVTKICFDYRI